MKLNGGTRRLRAALEALRRGTDYSARIAADPIAFPRRFSDPRDIEVAGWLASSLAYGSVPLFSAVLERILVLMGAKPHEYVSSFDPRRDLPAWRPLYYRMNRGVDIACLVYLMQQVLARHGSIGALFLSSYEERDEDVGPALERFIDAVCAIDTSPVYGRKGFPRGLSQFLSRPSKGSACKRLNLYLRWMARPDDGVDFGLWKGIPPSKLIIPVDTHILRIGRYLGLTRRRTAGWPAAKAVTEALRRIEPLDPLKYDFPLCHHGISGACPAGKAPEKCGVCPMLAVCAKGRMLAGGAGGPRNLLI